MSTVETLELLKAAQAKASDATLAKAFTQSANATTGLTAYDLEAPAKTLYPVLTPLRNELPRVGGGLGIQANWKAVTGINVNNMSAGVSEGNRGGVIATSVEDYLAAYKGIGLEDYVTFEAEYASKGFDDVKARATEGLLRSLMIQEERIILGGNGSLNLGTTPTPTVSDVTTGGSLAANTAYSVICVALSLEGKMNSTVAGGVTAVVTRTNPDGSTDTYGGGAAQKSPAGTVTTANDGNATHKVRASVTAVRGAFGYAWYVGTAGSEKLEAITSINSVEISSLLGTGQAASTLPSADKSTNHLVFDGYLSLLCKPGSNSYYKAMATGTAGTGTPLTSDATGGIYEIDEALQSFWDNYRLAPSTIWVSSQEMNYIRKKVFGGSATAMQRFVISVQDQGAVRGGSSVRGYTNPFTMGEAEEIPIRMHPNLPPGTIMFTTNKLPYPLSNVTNVSQIRTRQDYYQLEWPLRTRRYEYGVYADEVLQVYFTPAFGIITNIAAG